MKYVSWIFIVICFSLLSFAALSDKKSKETYYVFSYQWTVIVSDTEDTTYLGPQRIGVLKTDLKDEKSIRKALLKKLPKRDKDLPAVKVKAIYTLTRLPLVGNFVEVTSEQYEKIVESKMINVEILE